MVIVLVIKLVPASRIVLMFIKIQVATVNVLLEVMEKFVPDMVLAIVMEDVFVILIIMEHSAIVMYVEEVVTETDYATVIIPVFVIQALIQARIASVL
jgi:hypothetical protein